MAYINAATAGNFATVMIRNSATVDGTWDIDDFVTYPGGSIDVKALHLLSIQDITVTNNAGTFRWKELESLSEKVVTTVSTNSISGNFVLDPNLFFGTGSGSEAPGKGIFNMGNDKQKVYFVVFFDGYGTTGKKYIGGQGYLTSIAPKVSADSPVWVSPFTIEVTGDFNVGTTA